MGIKRKLIIPAAIRGRYDTGGYRTTVGDKTQYVYKHPHFCSKG